MAKKLWEKGTTVNPEIERFTVGRDRELDLLLARYDVLGSIAHSTMLESIGMLSTDEMKALHNELRNIHGIIENGKFVIEEDVEDVHSQVELMLTRRLGDTGKKIHSGRSRNDQVLLDLKLFTRNRLQGICHSVKKLFDALIEQSDRHKDVLMPGYTHLQVVVRGICRKPCRRHAVSAGRIQDVQPQPAWVGCRLWLVVPPQQGNDN